MQETSRSLALNTAETISLAVLSYDLLLSPHGTGKDYRECFESFIADCNDYIRKITAIRDEARMHMEKLLKAEESLENQNRESSHED